MTRVGIFGWGVIAPACPDIDTFAEKLQEDGSWLSAFDGFGPSTFLTGQPSFDFADYRPWIEARFAPTKFPQLQQKMGNTTLYAIGAFIQALGQNPGIEKTLQDLASKAHVLIGTGVGDLPTQYGCSLALYHAQRRWDRFWAAAERNRDRDQYEQADDDERQALAQQWEVPTDPRDLPDGAPQRDATEDAWFSFWMRRSEQLPEYLEAFEAIEAAGIKGDINADKLRIIRRKRSAFTKLQKQWQCPTPPWMSVAPNLIWNIANTPAAQVSMLGKITGPACAPIAACSSFGVALKLAMQAIRTGEAKVVVVGMADPPPHPMLVAAFYRARVLSADRRPSMPLSNLRGTHISGGACIWIVGDHEFMRKQGYRPLGLEIIGVGVTSDAEHIITPTKEGPLEAIRLALQAAGIEASDLGTWDMHATATPGDYQEIGTLQELVPDGLAVTARKGTFGHGMAVSGGWELTAQHLGLTRGELYPTTIEAEALHPLIATAPFRFVLNAPCEAPPGVAGKLSMGIGGVNACVISRRWEDGPKPTP
ncbi:MAG: beta-ketoacyl synthase N-terminal-like domain-containing protein [Acidobacteriota bacterium]